MTKFARARFLTTEFNHSTTITLGAITVAEVAVIIDRTISTVIIVLKSDKGITTAQAFLVLFLAFHN